MRFGVVFPIFLFILPISRLYYLAVLGVLIQLHCDRLKICINFKHLLYSV